MPRGTLEVLLIGANGLENTDFLGKMDPYVLLTYRTQEHKSSVAKDQGTKPDWNETFLFTVADFQCDLNLKIMDSDNGSKDDFVGEATIPVDAVLYEGNIPPRAYNVVKNNKFKGEINVALAFFPEEERCCEDY